MIRGDCQTCWVGRKRDPFAWRSFFSFGIFRTAPHVGHSRCEIEAPWKSPKSNGSGPKRSTLWYSRPMILRRQDLSVEHARQHAPWVFSRALHHVYRASLSEFPWAHKHFAIFLGESAKYLVGGNGKRSRMEVRERENRRRRCLTRLSGKPYFFIWQTTLNLAFQCGHSVFQ
jgi:hypothetical protein